MYPPGAVRLQLQSNLHKDHLHYESLNLFFLHLKLVFLYGFGHSMRDEWLSARRVCVMYHTASYKILNYRGIKIISQWKWEWVVFLLRDVHPITKLWYMTYVVSMSHQGHPVDDLGSYPSCNFVESQTNLWMMHSSTERCDITLKLGL